MDMLCGFCRQHRDTKDFNKYTEEIEADKGKEYNWTLLVISNVCIPCEKAIEKLKDLVQDRDRRKVSQESFEARRKKILEARGIKVQEYFVSA